MEIFIGILLFIIVSACALLALRVSLVIAYEQGGKTTAYLRILGFKIILYPKKEKKIRLSDYEIKRFRKRLLKERLRAEKKLLKKQKKIKAKKKNDVSAEQDEKKKLTAEDIFSTIELVTELAGTFFKKLSKHLKLDRLVVIIDVGSDDPMKTALLYGGVSQAVAYLVEFLDNTVTLAPKYPERDVRVNADFLSESFKMEIKLSASLRVWHVLDVLLSVAYGYVKRKYVSDITV